MHMYESISIHPEGQQMLHLRQRVVLCMGSAGRGGESWGEGMEDVGHVAAVEVLDLLGVGWVQVVCRV